MQQVRWVSSLRQAVVVDKEQIAAVPDGMAARAAGSMLCRELARAAQSYGVDVDDRDVEICSRDDDSVPFATLFVARWWPSTSVVELDGAHEFDGQVMEVREVGVPILVAVRSVSALQSGSACPGVSDEMMFELDGWNEDDRRWIYRAGV